MLLLKNELYFLVEIFVSLGGSLLLLNTIVEWHGMKICESYDRCNLMGTAINTSIILPFVFAKHILDHAWETA